MNDNMRNAKDTLKNNNTNDIAGDKDIAKTWISGQNCCTLIIGKKLAEKYGLTEPAHIVLEGTEEGILIKKLDF